MQNQFQNGITQVKGFFEQDFYTAMGNVKNDVTKIYNTTFLKGLIENDIHNAIALIKNETQIIFENIHSIKKEFSSGKSNTLDKQS